MHNRHNDYYGAVSIVTAFAAIVVKVGLEIFSTTYVQTWKCEFVAMETSIFSFSMLA